jgi:hypothetical protein
MSRALTVSCLLVSLASGAWAQRWRPGPSRDWYSEQGWLVGANYIPATAINQLEMWQAETFDPQRIDLELGWAEGLGMNSMRVFLHDLPWQQDAEGFKKRIEEFLRIASKHKMRVMFVLFDSSWDPLPKPGPQHAPTPGVYNSGWVQSPGVKALADPAEYPRLEAYVRGMIGAFANDKRVIAWDLWNEPDALNPEVYRKLEPANKNDLVLALLPKVFEWAREEHPKQPLTSGVWQGDWSDPNKLVPMEKIQLESSDVISFHNYGPPDDFEQREGWLEAYNRPIFCTGYMARTSRSSIEGTLPIAKDHMVAAYNSGLVAGKTQMYLPLDSWDHPLTEHEPAVWVHDIFRMDGTPYRPEEAGLIRTLIQQQKEEEKKKKKQKGDRLIRF